MHGKEWQALHLENLRGLRYWSWDMDGMSVPDSTLLWSLPESHCLASDMWVSWGSELSWILALLKGLGSHLFFSPWPALIGARRDWCAGHSSIWSFQGFFGFSWSILSQKRSSNGHERWTKSGSLTSGKRSPACTALQCSQSDLLLSDAITQVRSGICIGPDASWEKATGYTGIQIWKWHLDSGWEIQSSPWEIRPLCIFRSYWNSNIHSSPCLGKANAPQGGNCSH